MGTSMAAGRATGVKRFPWRAGSQAYNAGCKANIMRALLLRFNICSASKRLHSGKYCSTRCPRLSGWKVRDQGSVDTPFL